MTKETKELRRTYWALLTAFALLVAMGIGQRIQRDLRVRRRSRPVFSIT